jgi:Rrf2 family transcriptional regulator, iron-sulfur cluster assembly transcription factor
VISSTSDYALRALLVLARRRGLGPVRADEVADATGAPRNYMAKTLNALAKAGIVSSLRGPAGGFTLVAEPAALPIARVVDLFETPRAHPRCLLGAGPCDPTRPCAAHQRWTSVAEARRAPLASTTIADLLGDAA